MSSDKASTHAAFSPRSHSTQLSLVGPHSQARDVSGTLIGVHAGPLNLKDSTVHVEHAIFESPQTNVSAPSLQDIESALEILQTSLRAHYQQDPGIESLFERENEADKPRRSLRDCYINLALEKEEKEDTKSNTTEHEQAVKERADYLSSQEKTYQNLVTIAPNGLFALLADEKKKNPDAKPPLRLLVTGAAGVGKTTLSRYLAYCWALPPEDEKVLWHNRETKQSQFKWVFRVPLRVLLHFNPSSLKIGDIEKEAIAFLYACFEEESCRWHSTSSSAIVRDNFFLQNNQAVFEQTLRCCQGSKEALFLLDGLDEVSFLSNYQNDFKEPLNQQRAQILLWLLTRPSLLVTSRPLGYATFPVLSNIDRRIMSRGFQDQEIAEYIHIFFSPQSDSAASTDADSAVSTDADSAASTDAENLLAFLESNPNIKGIAHTPINLSFICYLWEKQVNAQKAAEKQTDRQLVLASIIFSPMTLGQLYYAMVGELLRVYFKRLKEVEGQPFDYLKSWEMEDLYNDEAIKPVLFFLGRVAFEGLQQNQLFFTGEKVKNLKGNLKTPEFIKLLISAHQSGLLRFSGDLHHMKQDDFFKASMHYEFMHLTFQEYLAAYYFANHYEASNTQLVDFLQLHKFASFYSVFWPFVASYLAMNDKPHCLQHFFEQLEKPRGIFELPYLEIMLPCLSEVLAVKKGTLSYQSFSSSYGFIYKNLEILFQWIFQELNKGNKAFVFEQLKSLLPTPVLIFIIQSDHYVLDSDQNKHPEFITEGFVRLQVELKDGLRDKDWKVRDSVLGFLRAHPACVEQDMEAWRASSQVALRDEDTGVRSSVLKFLCAHPACVEQDMVAWRIWLQTTLQDKEWRVRNFALDFLKGCPAYAERDMVGWRMWLQAILRNKEWEIEDSVFEFLGVLHAHPASMEQDVLAWQPLLQAVLRAPLLLPVSSSYGVLSFLKNNPICVEQNVALWRAWSQAALRDKDSEVRNSALKLLCDHPACVEEDVVTWQIWLQAALRDEDVGVRSAALEFLNAYPSCRKQDMVTWQSMLQTALRDEDAHVRSSAFRFFIDHPAWVEQEVVLWQSVLQSALRDENLYINKTDVFKFLLDHPAYVEQDVAAWQPLFQAVLRYDKSSGLVKNAARELLQAHPGWVQQDLVAWQEWSKVGLRDKDGDIRSATLWFLMTQPACVQQDVVAWQPILQALLGDEEGYVRRSALLFLLSYPTFVEQDVTAWQPLLQAALRHRNRDVRRFTLDFLRAHPGCVEQDVKGWQLWSQIALRGKDWEVRESSLYFLSDHPSCVEQDVAAWQVWSQSALQDEDTYVRGSVLRFLHDHPICMEHDLRGWEVWLAANKAHLDSEVINFYKELRKKAIKLNQWINRAVEIHFDMRDEFSDSTIFLEKVVEESNGCIYRYQDTLMMGKEKIALDTEQKKAGATNLLRIIDEKFKTRDLMSDSKTSVAVLSRKPEIGEGVGEPEEMQPPGSIVSSLSLEPKVENDALPPLPTLNLGNPLLKDPEFFPELNSQRQVKIEDDDLLPQNKKCCRCSMQ